jgi:hypothetical protein
MYLTPILSRSLSSVTTAYSHPWVMSQSPSSVSAPRQQGFAKAR